MRLYALLNFQDIVLYIFPTLVFVLLFGLALSFSYFRTKHAEEREKEIHHSFPENLEERRAPFPTVLVLTIAGTIVWGFFYILMVGLLEVKI